MRVIQSEPEQVWYPQSGPQSLAYLSPADEIYFGGSAGGGKSDCALGLALTAHVRSLFLRTNTTQLESVNARVHAMMRGADRWKTIGTHGGILNTAEGRMLELNGCESFADANKKFRGRDHDLKIFDEMPTFPRQVYEFVIGWNRTTVPGQRCRVFGAGNPPANPEEEWVLDYWAPWLVTHTAEPAEVCWFAKLDGEDRRVENGDPFTYKNELIYPRSRTFIPARLEDNPILESTGYRQTLQNMPEPYRSQLLYGDMNIGRSDAEHQLIPTEWVEISMRKWQERTQSEIEQVYLTCMGVDPSREGKDRTAICKRYGNWVAPFIVIPGKQAKDGPTIATKIMLNLEYAVAPIIIDIIGTAGGGVYDSLSLMGRNLAHFPFNGSKASEYRDKSGQIRMRNKRTEAYWRLREALDPTQPNSLILPPNKDLKVELTAQRWYLYSNGAGIEDKDDISKRIGRSPDLADALSMSMMTHDASGGWVAPGRQAAVPADTKFMGGVDPGIPAERQPRGNGNNIWGVK